ncbi:MAG: hypothetical protein QUS33_14095 [Dehalococcoidia bacterium]|nr:hypothetical protein [Dehalococcoidia bacterium]
MPIRWSAVQVDQAMNEVEARMDEAQLFLCLHGLGNGRRTPCGAALS